MFFMSNLYLRHFSSALNGLFYCNIQPRVRPFWQQSFCRRKMLNRMVPRLCQFELDQDDRFGFYEPAHLSNVHIFVYPELSVIGETNNRENGLRKKNVLRSWCISDEQQIPLNSKYPVSCTDSSSMYFPFTQMLHLFVWMTR